MQARQPQVIENPQPVMNSDMFSCRRKNPAVAYVGNDRRASREQFGQQNDWYLKVNFLENA
jgi:hypothetical protein